MNKLVLKGLRAVFFEIWNVLRTLVNYLSLIVELCLVYSSVLILMSFYFYGEVTFSMTAKEFFTSQLFSHMVMASSVIALLVTMLRILFRANSRKEKIRWALEQERRLSIGEITSFLHVMHKFGFSTIVDPNLWNYKDEIKRKIGFLKAALYLKEVDLNKFTEEDFAEFVDYISPYSNSDSIQIDKNKLEILQAAIPLMETLKNEIGGMTHRITYTSTTLDSHTLFREIPSICGTILRQKKAIEDVCSNTLNEELSKHIQKIESYSVMLMRDMNRLLVGISFPPYDNQWREPEVEAFKTIVSSESKSVREYYLKEEAEGK